MTISELITMLQNEPPGAKVLMCILKMKNKYIRLLGSDMVTKERGKSVVHEKR